MTKPGHSAQAQDAGRDPDAVVDRASAVRASAAGQAFAGEVDRAGAGVLRKLVRQVLAERQRLEQRAAQQEWAREQE